MFRKVRRSKRRLFRRRGSSIRRYKKPSSRRFKRRSSRSSRLTRVVSRSFPPNNPFGDVQVQKVRISGSYVTVVPVGSSSASIPAFQINGFKSMCSALASTFPNAAFLGQQFQSYRIYGVKFQLKYFSTTPQTSSQPMMMYIDACSVSTQFVAPTVHSIPEQRFAKWKLMPVTLGGSSIPTLTAYYRVKTFIPDSQITEAAFTGQTNLSSSPLTWTNPTAATPWVTFGVCAATGANMTSVQNFSILCVATVYCKFFERDPSAN